ncbi:MAG: hypothetical protein DRI23_01815 [Candidatus Cloacimonadota bacterium]|nr:MAG: hypothetical protein DRI23_01815 [Candidatus Cloacimonadota bacterium]
MNEFNPESYLLKIQKQKYKIAIFPILIVIISFFLHSSFQFTFLKYFSLAGLLGYVFVLMLHKVNKTVPPVCEQKHLLSPISGKIASTNNNKIEIIKSIFDPIDIRCSTSSDKIDIIWKNKKPLFFEEHCQINGKLIGMLIGKVNCVLKLPDEYKIEVEDGQKVFAGETILARISDNQA